MLQPLSLWINRSQPLPERFFNPEHRDIPHEDWTLWLSIEEVAPLHCAARMQWVSLQESRQRTCAYLTAAQKQLQGLNRGWLSSEEQQHLLAVLGEPPLPALPIYLITCTDPSGEHLVYVGRTKNTSRFSGGHAAALKLHAPEYANKEKRIYRATLWIQDQGDTISFDWIQPESLAERLLDWVESRLIYLMQPDLNNQKKRRFSGQWDFALHIQNTLPGAFLNETFI
jgi:hypothetical protein